ncbi:MAG: hypothetical protein L3J98_09090, partial [Gammaproteobacteria bacterium]|nr:hypothetical protein [Gammaproteobacteria bacterium]MCF6260296.1 hypothetical protein [Gammaproteobacteria bacterium]
MYNRDRKGLPPNAIKLHASAFDSGHYYTDSVNSQSLEVSHESGKNKLFRVAIAFPDRAGLLNLSPEIE